MLLVSCQSVLHLSPIIDKVARLRACWRINWLSNADTVIHCKWFWTSVRVSVCIRVCVCVTGTVANAKHSEHGVNYCSGSQRADGCCQRNWLISTVFPRWFNTQSLYWHLQIFTFLTMWKYNYSFLIRSRTDNKRMANTCKLLPTVLANDKLFEQQSGTFKYWM